MVMDDWLRERYERYAGWLDAGRVDYTSKVIPVRESLDTRQWVLPTAQVLEIVAEAQVIALTNCVCRTHYQRCSGPREVCLLLGDYGHRFIDRGMARSISREEAAVVLREANLVGLVHLSLYQPNREFYALCSCCPCCCHDLQILLAHGHTRLVAQADYIARTDPDRCVACGICEDRCVFRARILVDPYLRYDPGRCYGCGLCVTTCPTEAISLEPRIKGGF